jgi:23S rRNA pseudouridine2605 synthase
MAARKKTLKKSKPTKRAAGKSGGKKSSSKASSVSKTGKKKRVARPAKKNAPGRQSTQLADGPQRLQRVMAAAGIGSRRECELIIQEGRVEVDGNIIITLGTKVDLDKQKVYVDGALLREQRLEYFMLNKPQGIVSTSNDPSGRPRVIDLIKTRSRVYNVGRLDQSSEGLILVTNDGELANRLTHPRYGIEKKYQVQVAGQPTPKELKALVDGVYLAEGKAQATSAKFIRRAKENSWIEITLTEGRNREIRRLLAKIGHKVRRLKRVAIGSLKLGELPTGAHRELMQGELRELKKVAFGKPPARKKKPAGTRRKARGLDELKSEVAADKEAALKLNPRKKASSKSAEKPAKRNKKRNSKKKGARSATKSVSKRGAARDTTGRRVKKASKQRKRR